GGTGIMNNGQLIVGRAGAGTFTQNAGRASSNVVQVGSVYGGSGYYKLFGGSLNSNFTYVGNAGTGQFLQNGGQHYTLDLRIGDQFGAAGTYTMFDGQLFGQNQARVGGDGNGTLALYGGNGH